MTKTQLVKYGIVSLISAIIAAVPALATLGRFEGLKRAGSDGRIIIAVSPTGEAELVDEMTPSMTEQYIVYSVVTDSVTVVDSHVDKFREYSGE